MVNLRELGMVYSSILTKENMNLTIFDYLYNNSTFSSSKSFFSICWSLDFTVILANGAFLPKLQIFQNLKSTELHRHKVFHCIA